MRIKKEDFILQSVESFFYICDMKVLSLFDGMSCGRVALQRAGIAVDEYYSSEIDPHALKVANANWPQDRTLRLGDVTGLVSSSLPKIDLLIGGSPCFVAGTKVITKTSIKNIEDVVVGDYVLTHTNTFQKVVAVGSKHSDTILLKAQGMKPTTTTHEHPYYVRSMTRKWDNSKRTSFRVFSEPSWKAVSELRKGDFIGMPRLQTSENVYDLTPEECWVIGRYIADGHTRKDFRGSEDRPNDRHWQLILSIGSHKLDILRNSIHTLHYSVFPHTRSVHRVVFSNKRLVEIVEAECGCGAENKHISMNLLNLPIELLKSLLVGYMSGDGSDRGSYHSASSISEPLIMTLNLALLKVYGINSSYSYIKNQPTTYIEGRLINQKDSYVTDFRFDMKVQSRAELIDDIMWLPVKSIENTRCVELVYNLEVENDNSYTANNIIVHNCQGFSFAGKQLNFEDPRSKLFFEFVRLRNEIEPTYFLLENVVMKKIHRDVITKYLGVEPVMINSADFSIQDRKRLYWTNIPILPWKPTKEMFNRHLYRLGHGYITDEIKLYPKYPCLAAQSPATKYRIVENLDLAENATFEAMRKDKRITRSATPEECEEFQTLPIGYTSCVPKTHRYKMIGNGWTVDVIAHILKGIK